MSQRAARHGFKAYSNTQDEIDKFKDFLRSIEGEEFRPIPGYPGYFVSNLGNVYSHRKMQRGQHEDALLKVVKVGRDGFGWRLYDVHGCSQIRTCHSIMGQVWFPSQWHPNCRLVHKDGDKSNNRVDNLEFLGKRGVGQTANGKWFSSIVHGGTRLVGPVREDKDQAHNDFYEDYMRVHGVPPW